MKMIDNRKDERKTTGALLWSSSHIVEQYTLFHIRIVIRLNQEQSVRRLLKPRGLLRPLHRLHLLQHLVPHLLHSGAPYLLSLSYSPFSPETLSYLSSQLCTLQVDLEVVEKQAATRTLAATFTWCCPACQTDPCHLPSWSLWLLHLHLHLHPSQNHPAFLHPCPGLCFAWGTKHLDSRC